ncbi:hypothetical protein [Streptomyces sp. TRM68416]|uniref:hypothetical protein n=1 Tax=Streptomyces sp. TRM68416 TaxID=2758412 RepID=UPI001661AAC0|nr:hypothetical protein [Streptomyces sp. TRM68416]MBD0844674.1 hypothetical protein [Streptomyces sp. TRM68416]
MTTNPHPLINRWAAVDAAHSSIGTTFTAVFRPTGLTMQTLRQDRIRDEAFEVDDPLHLMRLFGISSQTAMRYISGSLRTHREASPMRRAAAINQQSRCMRTASCGSRASRTSAVLSPHSKAFFHSGRRWRITSRALSF